MYDDRINDDGMPPFDNSASSNPFRPIAFSERLKEPTKRPQHMHAHAHAQAFQPGQLYGTSAFQPQSAPSSYDEQAPHPFAPLSPAAPFSPVPPQTAQAQPYSHPDLSPASDLPPYLKKRPTLGGHTHAAHTDSPADLHATDSYTTVGSNAASAGSEAVFCSLNDYLAPEPPVKNSSEGAMLDVTATHNAAVTLEAFPATASHAASPAPAAPDVAAPSQPSRTRRRRAERNASTQPAPAPEASATVPIDTCAPVDFYVHQDFPAPADDSPSARNSMPADFLPSADNSIPVDFSPPIQDDRLPPAYPFDVPYTPRASYAPEPFFEGSPVEAVSADYPAASFVTDEIAAFFDEPVSPSYLPPYDEPMSDGHGAAPANLPPYDNAIYEPDSPQIAPPSLPAPLRDPFAPAVGNSGPAPLPPPKQKQTAPVKPPVRPWRVIALIAATVMLLFCGIVGGRILIDLSRNEREMERLREEYLQREGIEMASDGTRVELLPPDVTFAPTSTPPVIETPSPEPRIPINENAIASLNKRDTSNVQEVPEETATPNPRTKATAYPDNPLRNITESMRELHAEYPAVVGRLVINGVLDEVVVQRNNTYYLTRNYRGTKSDAGSVFVDESCSIEKPPENLLLRGQSSIAGKVFAPLWQYQTGGRDFVASATVASLSTLYEDARYRLFAVIVADSDPASANYFNYASQPTFTTDEAMLAYVQSVRSHSLYEFNVDVQASDRLLTLATLGTDNRCLVLVFRMFRAEEAAR